MLIDGSIRVHSQHADLEYVEAPVGDVANSTCTLVCGCSTHSLHCVCSLVRQVCICTGPCVRQLVQAPLQHQAHL
eukprot:6449784-Amphidinium_carterae.1